MILEQFVEVIANHSNKNYYIDKGYNLDIDSTYIDQNGRLKKVWFILVNINDVPLSAKNVSFTRICDKCGKIERVYPINKRDVCYNCAHPKSVHYSSCTSCGKSLGHWNRDVKLCRECWRKNNKGENHPSWKPDLDPEKRKLHSNRSTDKYKEWEVFVKTRDNYTCAKCNKYDEHIAAHHIFDKVNYPDLIYDVNNGICLCNSCHRIFHRVYTRKIKSKIIISTPELLLSFLQEYIL